MAAYEGLIVEKIDFADLPSANTKRLLDLIPQKARRSSWNATGCAKVFRRCMPPDALRISRPRPSELPTAGLR